MTASPSSEKDSNVRLFMDVRVSTWVQAKAVLERLRGYVFRGQGNSSWKLQSGLERAGQRWRMPADDLAAVEAQILYEFTRRAHHYVNMPPSRGDDLEWLALIQHYGGPTRLLDFTHSSYIAAFFALENTGDEAAIWAIDRKWLHARVWKSRGIEDVSPGLRARVVEISQEILNDPRRSFPGILFVEPFRLNERMGLQQGVFLFPCDITRSFEENLFVNHIVADSAAVVEFDGTGAAKSILSTDVPIIRIRLPEAIHSEALIDLASMNISAATLFGGLDGFARSLSLEGRRLWERRQRLTMTET